MTVSGILERLEKRGLLGRFANPADSRAKLAAHPPGRSSSKRPVIGLEIYEIASWGRSEEKAPAHVAASAVRDNLSGKTFREGNSENERPYGKARPGEAKIETAGRRGTRGRRSPASLLRPPQQ